jgi:hypothetical protein
MDYLRLVIKKLQKQQLNEPFLKRITQSKNQGKNNPFYA